MDVIVGESSQNVNSQTDWTPVVGMEFDTPEDAWNHWGNYGKQMGFGVRKQFENKRKSNGKVTTKRFVCCKEGFRKVDKRNHRYTRHRDETRTNCSVGLSISLIRETGKYKVYDFVAEHNHILHLEGTTYMMRSHRKMSEVQASEIDLACASGISPKATHALMSREAGGRENLGYTELDQKNYLRSRRQRNLIYGEAGSLLNYFQEQVHKNPLFHYAVQLDTKEKIAV